jgi:hypothetical protein
MGGVPAYVVGQQAFTAVERLQITPQPSFGQKLKLFFKWSAKPG